MDMVMVNGHAFVVTATRSLAWWSMSRRNQNCSLFSISKYFSFPILCFRFSRYSPLVDFHLFFQQFVNLWSGVWGFLHPPPSMLSLSSISIIPTFEHPTNSGPLSLFFRSTCFWGGLTLVHLGLTIPSTESEFRPFLYMFRYTFEYLACAKKNIARCTTDQGY